MPTCVLVVSANRDASNALELLNVLQSLTCLANVCLLNERFAVFLGEVGDGEHHSHPLLICLEINMEIVFWRHAQLLFFVGGRSQDNGFGMDWNF